ncbi:MAG: hypothetical protein ACT4NV_17050 [Rhodoferax sp.]
MTLLVLALLLLAVGAGVYWLRGNLDALVARAIREHGSAMTQASVQVERVHIDASNGRGTLQGLVIGNPQGFKTAHALQADVVELEVDISTLASSVVVVRRLAVLAPDVVYEKGASGTNFEALQKNIAHYLGPQDPAKPPRKFIVEDFSIRKARAQASAAFMNGQTVAVPLPDLHLRQLGRAQGGATAAELAQEVTAALKAQLSGAVHFDRLMQSAGSALDKAGQAIKGLFK